MPTISRWFIKAGMVCFLFALLLKLLMEIPAMGRLWPQIVFARPVFYHLLMMGWVTQVIFGVSIWMFPRHTRSAPRGNERLGWICFFTLNSGLLLRVIAEPQQMLSSTTVWTVSLFASALLQWIAVILYTGVIWQRVKGK
jgi:hypothetical protein